MTQEQAQTQSKKKKLKKDSEIEVMNNTPGGLTYINKRNSTEWRFENYGDIDTMPFSELITMKSSQKAFIYEPWLIILNEDAVAELRLKEFYKTILIPEDMDKFYEMEKNKMEEILEKMPPQMKETLVKITRDKITNEELTDFKKIKTIEEKLDINLVN